MEQSSILPQNALASYETIFRNTGKEYIDMGDNTLQQSSME
jgi:hypothetical protein